MTRRLVLAAAALVIGLAVVPRAPFADGAAERITYVDHVKPILDGGCISCHAPGNAKGGLDLTTFRGIVSGGSSGKTAVAGDPNASAMYRRVAHLEQPFMPPDGQLSPAFTEQLRRWIAGGMLETQTSAPLSAPPPPPKLLAMTPRTAANGTPPLPPRLPLEPPVALVRVGPVTALAASPTAPVIAHGSSTMLTLHDAATGALRGVLPFPEGRVEALRFSRDGELLLAAGGEPAVAGHVVAWDVRQGRRVLEVAATNDSVLACDLSPDRRHVAFGGPGRRVYVHDTASGQRVFELAKHTDWITAVRYSPDGVLLATADRAGNLVVWEAASGREYLDLRGHARSIPALEWWPDSNALVSGSEDGTLRVWACDNGRELKRQNAHGGVVCLDVAATGTIATGGRDRTIALWNAQGDPLRAFGPFPEIVTAVAWSAGEVELAAGDFGGRAAIVVAADGKPRAELTLAPPSLEPALARASKEREDAEVVYGRMRAAFEEAEDAYVKATEAFLRLKGERELARHHAALVSLRRALASEIVARAQAERQLVAHDARETELAAADALAAERDRALVAERDQAAATAAPVEARLAALEAAAAGDVQRLAGSAPIPLVALAARLRLATLARQAQAAHAELGGIAARVLALEQARRELAQGQLERANGREARAATRASIVAAIETAGAERARIEAELVGVERELGVAERQK